jgi:hypothetical protein
MRSSLLSTSPGKINLVIAPHAGIDLVIETVTYLATTGNVRVIDCGNSFNVYPLAKSIRRQTTDLQSAMDRVLLNRAFTCYQVVTMLTKEHSKMPVLVIDFLATFLDENVAFSESKRLLNHAIAELNRISSFAQVLVTVRPLLTVNNERISLLNDITRASENVYRLESTLLIPESAIQLPLFKS